MLTPLDYAALKDIGWEVPDKLIGLHGDWDDDLDVDGLDFLNWQRGVGMASGGASLGDISSDSVTDNFDLWMWYNHYGATGSQGSVAGSGTIPEPASLVLVGLCARLDTRDFMGSRESAL